MMLRAMSLERYPGNLALAARGPMARFYAMFMIVGCVRARHVMVMDD